MKRVLCFVLAMLLFSVVIVGCETNAVDFPSVADFENALNNGEDLTGKTVTFTIKEFVPSSAFGYNLQAGEHLNFCSSQHPGVETGDTITVKVTSVTSLLGSYIIEYEMVK